MCVLTGILHGAGLWQLPKQLYLPAEETSARASNSHLKYVWYESARLHCCPLRQTGEHQFLLFFVFYLVSLQEPVFLLHPLCRLVYMKS